jgi:hypothetical protein
MPLQFITGSIPCVLYIFFSDMKDSRVISTPAVAGLIGPLNVPLKFWAADAEFPWIAPPAKGSKVSVFKTFLRFIFD